MQRLSARVRARDVLGGADTAQMYALFECYYDGVSHGQFESDLASKSYVIELHEEGVLRGFSTIALIDFVQGGVARRAIYSGDTIIDHRYWGEQALPLAFCRFAGTVYAAAPDQPLYWFLISKGYRTYRYLNVFAHQYYPRGGVDMPVEARACLDHLAQGCFGDSYDAVRGILHFPRSRGHLKPEWAEVREGVGTRPEVRFFLDKNPGYRSGDELVCITQLIPANLRSYARRAFLKGISDFEHTPVLSGDQGQRGAVSPAVAASTGATATAAAQPAAA